MQIQAVVKKYDILFIADEVLYYICLYLKWSYEDIWLLTWFFHISLLKVICAFGRLGTMFGCDKYNIKPDLVSLAKVNMKQYLSFSWFRECAIFHFCIWLSRHFLLHTCQLVQFSLAQKCQMSFTHKAANLVWWYIIWPDLHVKIIVADMIFLILGSFSHGFTYSGHPVSCAVAIEALKIYKCVPLYLWP